MAEELARPSEVAATHPPASLNNVPEDDQPFGTTGHPCLSQLICHTTDTVLKIIGKVVGFLSEDNTDSKG